MSNQEFTISKTVWKVFIGLSFVSIVLECFTKTRKSHFAESGLQSIDGWFGFYGLLAVISATVLVVIAVAIEKFISKDEDYYNGSH